MARVLNYKLIVFAMTLMLIAPFMAARAQSTLAAPASQQGDKLVLAFYYLWYGPSSFDGGQMDDRPVANYISDHPDVIDRQVREAKDAGIDAFISSWTGTGTETDQNFPKLLNAAAAHNFKATIYFEVNSA